MKPFIRFLFEIIIAAVVALIAAVLTREVCYWMSLNEFDNGYTTGFMTCSVGSITLKYIKLKL